MCMYAVGQFHSVVPTVRLMDVRRPLNRGHTNQFISQFVVLERTVTSVFRKMMENIEGKRIMFTSPPPLLRIEIVKCFV